MPHNNANARNADLITAGPIVLIDFPSVPDEALMISRRDLLRQSTLISLAPTVPSFLARTVRAFRAETRRANPGDHST